MSGRAAFDLEKSFQLTQVPHPSWRPGDSQAKPDGHGNDMLDMEPEKIGTGNTYKLLIGGVVPRPIAFVSTRSKSGRHNLAPFSFFNVISHDPPALAISVGTNGQHAKDTAQNILETGQFVVNIISEWFAESANYTAIDAPPEEDEFEISGLTPIDSIKIDAPRVKESAFQMECKVIQHVPMINKEGITTYYHIIGEIVMFHVDKYIIDPDNYHIALDKLRPLSRLGGISYGRTVEGYEIPRPKWDDRSA
ncbi:hypothetical protein INT43_003676 [Umbelopsis isabellina]|uniref:Flavin reductase like domain-containing protein n=1 Tax=Mortierella isabellina TaxID=91625 RepID=A0A8H7PU17_MORIS|nr:hypothetical protein INT43_003676 [Umbelopsis isabellina]